MRAKAAPRLDRLPWARDLIRNTTPSLRTGNAHVAETAVPRRSVQVFENRSPNPDNVELSVVGVVPIQIDIVALPFHPILKPFPSLMTISASS